MSNFVCEVVPIVLELHPNAHSLSLVKVYGYTCAVNTKDFENVTQAIYIPVDSVLPDDMIKTMSYLKGNRVKAVKLRGVYSEGMLLPDKNKKYKLSQDVSKELGVTKYEEKFKNKQEKINTKVPFGLGFIIRYISQLGKGVDKVPWFREYTDIENIKRYSDILDPEEEVVCLEKIHGSNTRYLYHKGKFIVGSHYTQKVVPTGRKLFLLKTLYWILAKLGYPGLQKSLTQSNWWSKAAQEYNIEYTLKENPSLQVFGEVYGCRSTRFSL